MSAQIQDIGNWISGSCKERKKSLKTNLIFHFPLKQDFSKIKLILPLNYSALTIHLKKWVAFSTHKKSKVCVKEPYDLCTSCHSWYLCLIHYFLLAWIQESFSIFHIASQLTNIYCVFSAFIYFYDVYDNVLSHY